MTDPTEEKLDKIIELLQSQLAIRLSYDGMSFEEIRKYLGVGKQTINKMLKGIKKKKP